MKINTKNLIYALQTIGGSIVLGIALWLVLTMVGVLR